MTDHTGHNWTLHVGDTRAVLPTLADGSVNCVVTSPPYWGLRDYGNDSQIGLEQTPEAYVAEMVAVFREVRRVLRDDGVLWLNLGDSYASSTASNHGRGKAAPATNGRGDHQSASGWQNPERRAVPMACKPKDLVGIPWMVAFALRADGWYLRSDCIWSKPNPMPESIQDRPTKAHEYLFLLSKSERYYYDADAVAEPGQGQTGAAASFKRSTKEAKHPSGAPSQHRLDRVDVADSGHRKALHGPTYSRHHTAVEGGQDLRANPGPTRNRRTVWTIPTEPYPGAHFAVMPTALVEPCILAGCPRGGVVLDPFAGAGTVLYVASMLGRQSVGIELNPDSAALCVARMAGGRRAHTGGTPDAAGQPDLFESEIP